MNPWLIVGALLLAAATGAGGIRIGMQMERTGWQEKEIARADKIIVKQEILIREVPKIVTKTVTKEKVIEKEVERVVTLIEKALPVDCALPDRYGELLVGAARGLEPDATGGIAETAGAYGCAEVLEATLSDLKAGWINSTRLAGLQEYVTLITKDQP